MNPIPDKLLVENSSTSALVILLQRAREVVAKGDSTHNNWDWVQLPYDTWQRLKIALEVVESTP